MLLIFALSACWGTDEEDDNGTSGGNTLTPISLGQNKTLRGKYEITEYTETYDNRTIDADNATSFLGEMEIETQTTVKTMEYAVSYVIDGRSGSASEKFTLTPNGSGRYQIDGTKITPQPDTVHDLAASGSYYLVVEIEGMEKLGSDAKYDLYIRAKKVSDNPAYIIP